MLFLDDYENGYRVVRTKNDECIQISCALLSFLLLPFSPAASVAFFIQIEEKKLSHRVWNAVGEREKKKSWKINGSSDPYSAKNR